MDNQTNKTERDGALASIWQSEKQSTVSASINSGEVYDVLIVGGGITGLTSALLLAAAGKSVVVAEAHQVGFGTTGGTSAHLNTFFDATYPDIEKSFGKDAAKLVALGGTQALQLINGFIAKYDIECDFEWKDGYLFAETEDEGKQLEEIMAASLNAGVKVEASDKNGVVIFSVKSLLFPRQAQFHPLKYLYALAKAAQAEGVILLENTLIEDIQSADDLHTATSGELKIVAKHIIYATHLPPGINLLDIKCAPYRSYILGVRLEDENYPDALAYDLKEPYHYFRTHRIEGLDYLLIGGEDHKTGHGDPEEAFQNLEKYTSQFYNVASIPYRWSSQYYVPDDGLPYIGQMPLAAKGIYIATGFNGNGLTFGTLSAQIFTDLINGEDNAYTGLFSPSRVKPLTGTMDFIRENADVAYHFIADRFKSSPEKELPVLENGDGKLIKIDGKQVAAYRDDQGELHLLHPVCTHAGCIVQFNSVEKSWDCPCHGGRFDVDGQVITGPPRLPLERFVTANK